MKTLCLSILLLAAAGCSCKEQRFVAINEHPGIALDTKTGQLCNANTTQPTGQPLCFDLYKKY